MKLGDCLGRVGAMLEVWLWRKNGAEGEVGTGVMKGGDGGREVSRQWWNAGEEEIDGGREVRKGDGKDSDRTRERHRQVYREIDGGRREMCDRGERWQWGAVVVYGGHRKSTVVMMIHTYMCMYIGFHESPG